MDTYEKDRLVLNKAIRKEKGYYYFARDMLIISLFIILFGYLLGAATVMVVSNHIEGIWKLHFIIAAAIFFLVFSTSWLFLHIRYKESVSPECTVISLKKNPEISWIKH